MSSRLKNSRRLRSGLAAWIAAGSIGLAVAGPAESALAAEAPARVPTSAATPAPAAERPAYYLHQVVPDAPANALALTIDDGPNPVWTPKVLAVLRQNGVKATFCLVGSQAHAHPDLVRRIVAEGHELCDHSETHPQPFSHRSASAIEQEISQAQADITAAAGTAPRFFRAPGGDWSPEVFASTARHGLTSVAWNVDPQDWSRPGTQKIADRLLAAKPGDVVLCHDGDGDRPGDPTTDRSETVQALQTVLPKLKSRGYTFVTL